MSCLYILEINPLSVNSFANIFSHSEGCLFILFIKVMLKNRGSEAANLCLNSGFASELRSDLVS